MKNKDLKYWINKLNQILSADPNPYTQLPDPLNAIRDLAKAGIDVSAAFPVLEIVNNQHYHEHGCGVESTIEEIKKLAKNKRYKKPSAEKSSKTSKDKEVSLETACTEGNAKQVDLLLKKGFKPSNKIFFLTLCLVERPVKKYVEVIQLLIEKGGINLDSISKNDGETVLTCAIDQYAAHNCYGGFDYLPIIKLLLDKNADPFLKNKKGKNAFDVAKSTCRFKIEILLLDYSKKKGKVGIETLTDACVKGDVEQVKLLLNKGVKPDIDTLSDTISSAHHPFTKKYLDIINLLIEKGKINLNTKDKNGNPVLRLAISYFRSDDENNSPNCKTRSEIIKLLLEKGANPFVKDFMGETAFSTSRLNAKAEALILNYLIKTGKYRKEDYPYLNCDVCSNLCSETKLDRDNTYTNYDRPFESSQKVSGGFICSICKTFYMLGEPTFESHLDPAGDRETIYYRLLTRISPKRP